MERRFGSRLHEMLDQAYVSTDVLRGVLPRLEKFVEPFAATLPGLEHRRHAAEYVTGLMSKLNAGPVKESPTCMINSGRGFRSSLESFPGTINRCS